MQDFTVITGKGNSGAVGIDYLGNNHGAIRNVNVRSDDNKGVAGVVIGRAYNGPALVKNVVVDGFDYGIDSRNLRVAGRSSFRANMVIENALLRQQKKAAIAVGDFPLSVRGLASRNSVPAILMHSDKSDIAIVDGDWRNGSGDAVKNVDDNSKGIIYARNISMSGYSSFGVGNNSNSYLEEYSSKGTKSLFSGSGKSQRLPIKETPTYHTNDMNQWANAGNLGLQNALNSGKAIVYIPRNYNVPLGTFNVPAHVT